MLQFMTTEDFRGMNNSKGWENIYTSNYYSIFRENLSRDYCSILSLGSSLLEFLCIAVYNRFGMNLQKRSMGNNHLFFWDERPVGPFISLVRVPDVSFCHFLLPLCDVSHDPLQVLLCWVPFELSQHQLSSERPQIQKAIFQNFKVQTGSGPKSIHFKPCSINLVIAFTNLWLITQEHDEHKMNTVCEGYSSIFVSFSIPVNMFVTCRGRFLPPIHVIILHIIQILGRRVKGQGVSLQEG